MDRWRWCGARSRRQATSKPTRRTLDPAGEEPRGLAGHATVAHVRLRQAQMRHLLAPVFAGRDARASFGDLPTHPKTLGTRLRTNAALLRFDVVTRLEAGRAGRADRRPFARPGSGVHAVKMIVPGLEVETMTYHRVGERNVRRLLVPVKPREPRFPTRARGGGDASTGRHAAGDPHGSSQAAARRRSVAGHEKRWIPLMEDLYVLYREPSRHVTAFSRTENG